MISTFAPNETKSDIPDNEQDLKKNASKGQLQEWHENKSSKNKNVVATSKFGLV
ncbi:hypothetical protein MA16_Dca025048 [Dendrobium catenatum]|uniref:Uncharacterized protein n=1 Tax=Dendrobium catenatum TaxID=906689 RepID=A0A2I0VW04_9ASPA|nr:hypothetical protein MA16_Dca025048 [Dendrobium catenatum]